MRHLTEENARIETENAMLVEQLQDVYAKEKIDDVDNNGVKGNAKGGDKDDNWESEVLGVKRHRFRD